MTKAELRRAVPGYPDGDEAFDRMFERDKDDLRDLGIPVEAVPVVRGFDDEVGYRVDRDRYALPEVRLTADEIAVLSLAARMWSAATLAGPARSGLLKLRAGDASPDADTSALVGLDPRVDANEPAFPSLWRAARDRAAVRFEYRTAGGGPATPRVVEPWGLLARSGHWYLVGHDRDRDAPRAFRVSRIAGAVRVVGRPGSVDVPAGLDLAALVRDRAAQEPAGPVRVWLRTGTGAWVRRLAGASTPAEGGDVVTVTRADVGMLADHLAGLGPAAVVLEPAPLREEVRRRLAGAASPRRRPPGVAIPAAGPPAARRSAGGLSPTATGRLARLLALVPYLLERPGARVTDVAAEFGIPEDTLVDDLELLFVCGLPGHLPDDLIEADVSDGVIHLSNADTLARPLRLGVDEAIALLVGLRALAELPGGADNPALDRARAKLEAAAGEAARDAARVAVDVRRPELAAESSVVAAARDALERGRRMHLGYYVPARDEATERDVDPLRVLVAEGHTYLEAWCHRARDVRLFRLDRVTEATVLDVPAAPPPEAKPRDLAVEGLFRPSPDDVVAELLLAPGARWVAEYHPCEHVAELGQGWLHVTLRTPDARWLVRLVLRLGGQARVVTPAALGREVRRTARRALAGYEVPAASASGPVPAAPASAPVPDTSS